MTGIWCMCQIGYAYSGDPREVPWQLLQLKPVQMSRDDRENYMQQRSQFTDSEWIDLLMQSIGFNPDLFSDRAKLLHLVRMVPFVERNYNLVELGPKGTGKSHIYSEFSPHGMLISGGEVTVAKLFVNNSNGRLGLVGYWDTVAFDEFAGKAKKAGRDLVDIMKNYMANKSFSRGVETFQGEASMAFVGNTSHNVPYMLKTPTCSKSCRSNTMIRRSWTASTSTCRVGSSNRSVLRCSPADSDSWSTIWRRFCTTCAMPITATGSKSISNCLPHCPREIRTASKKTFSGLMKLIYPDGNATPEQMEPLLRCAIEGRKRVKDQLCRIDSTMEEVEFTYKRVSDGEVVAVQTLEELDYPQLYWRGRVAENSEDEGEAESSVAGDAAAIAGNEGEACAPEHAINALPVARQQETATILQSSVLRQRPTESSGNWSKTNVESRISDYSAPTWLGRRKSL